MASTNVLLPDAAGGLPKTSDCRSRPIGIRRLVLSDCQPWVGCPTKASSVRLVYCVSPSAGVLDFHSGIPVIFF